MSEASFEDIFTTFYQSPSTARAVAALEGEARQASALDKGHTDLEVYYFATIARRYPSIVRDYEALFDRSPSRFVLSVLAQLNDDATRQFLAARLEDDRFRALRREIRHVVKGEAGRPIAPLIVPGGMPLGLDVSALDLDLLWAEFFVTGDTSPVERIIDVLEWPDVVRGRVETSLRRPAILRPLGAGMADDWRRCVPARVIRRLRIAVDWKKHLVETPEDLDWLSAASPGSHQYESWSTMVRYLSPDRLRAAVVKGAALWSLGANAIEHAPVLETCEAQITKRTGRAELALLEIAAYARLTNGDQGAASAWARRYLELSPENIEVRSLLERAAGRSSD